MYFITVMLKNLLRRKVRTLLTTMGLAVAVGAMVALVGVASGFERSVLDTFQKRGVDIVVLAAGAPNQLSSDLDEHIAEKIGALAGVRFVTPGLIDILSFKQGFSSIYVLVQGWKSDNPAFNDLEIIEGRRFKPEERRVAMLGSNAASNLKKKVGDLISIKHEEFKVVALFHSFSVFENDSIIAPLEDLQRLLKRKGSVTGFSVSVKNAPDLRASIDSIAASISGLTDDKGRSLALSALPTSEYVSQSAHVQLTLAMAWITSLIALMIGTIGMANTMAMSVVERTREIGILRAIGWRKWRVIRMILGESLFLSAAGGLFGIVGAIIACRAFATLPQVGGFIQGDVPLEVIVQGFFIALVVGLIGGIWPAWRAASLQPTEAIYHE